MPRLPPLPLLALLPCALAAAALAQGKPPPLSTPGGQAPRVAGPDGKPPPAPAPGPAVPGPSASEPGRPATPGTPLGPQEAAAGKPPALPPGTPGAPGNVPPSGGTPGSTPGGLRAVSSGTGFVVAATSLLTNHHVAAGCSEMRVRTATGADLRATVAASDERRDLALLTVQGEPGPVLRFRNAPEIRRGDEVVTYGFPLSGILSSGPTLTTGSISALAGLRDNATQFQISAPVQPGNSGGPLLDYGGNVVGVVVSKLNAQRIAQATGDIPQNVNFAVKGSEAVDFLRRNGVQPQMADTSGPPRNAAEVGEIAHPSTVFLRCMR